MGHAGAIRRSAVVGVVVWLLAGCTGDDTPPTPGDGGLLEIPEVGAATAGHLDDGTPVFVSQPVEGDVLVLDATNPHLGDKLVSFCRSSGWFEDLHHGSTFNGWGDYTGGPAPAGLAMYPHADVRTMRGPRVRVTGAADDAPERDDPRGEQQPPRGPWCGDTIGSATIHEPPDELPTLGGRDVPDDRWVWARLVVGGTDAMPLVCASDGRCPPDAPSAPQLAAHEPEGIEIAQDQGVWLVTSDGGSEVRIRMPADPAITPWRPEAG